MKQVRIAITGDLNLTGSFENKIINNDEIFSSEILHVLRTVDYCICNLEGPVTNNNNRAVNSLKTNLRSPLNSITYLSQRNIKVFNLANNHIFDYGKEGLYDTINELQKNNCLYFGAWLENTEINNSAIIGNELKIQLKSFTEKIKSYKYLGLATKKHLRINDNKIANWNILFHHGGEEYTLYPSPTKRNLLKRVQKKAKPDIIISHHTHTLQGIEKTNKTSIFFSLGNFIFDIKPHHLYQYTDESAILILTFDEKNWHYELVPIKIKRKEGLVNLAENNIIRRFNNISDFSGYKDKWRKEAHRVLYERKASLSDADQKEKPLHKKKNWELIFSLKFYRKAVKVIFDNNNRSLYWNALIYKLFYKK